MVNILISSVSKKIPLIKAVKNALKRFSSDAVVIGGDTDPKCLGRYFVDSFWEMPSIDELTVEALIHFCQSEKIKLIIPTRDGELTFYAACSSKLRQEGIEVMVSPSQAIALALDKYAFSEAFAAAIPAYLDYRQLKTFPCFVKARFGAGGRSLGCKLMEEEAKSQGAYLSDAIYQPYIEGAEISVDLYIKKDGEIHGMICRERNVVIGGESQVTTTICDQEVEDLCVSAAKRMQLSGHVMFQCIREAATEKLYLLECNPRFGGASTASIHAGLDSFYWKLCELSGTDLPPFNRVDKEITMVRYAEDRFLDL